MAKRQLIVSVGVFVLTVGLFLSGLAGWSHSHLFLPIMLVTCSSYGLIYAVGFGVVSKRLASAILGIVLVGSLPVYDYLGRFISIWAGLTAFVIFLLLGAMLYLADAGKIRENEQQAERTESLKETGLLQQNAITEADSTT